MELLVGNLVELFWSALGVVWAVCLLVGPWSALISWVALWLLAVDWKKLYPVLIEQGGLMGVLLLGVMMILIWGVVAPPESGRHVLLGLSVSNFVGKTVYVTSLYVIAALCGSVQLAGGCDPFLNFSDPSPAEDTHHGHGGHGTSGHGTSGHGHDDHDHAHGHAAAAHAHH